MALVAQFVSQYDASNRAQFVSQYAEDVQTSTLITVLDAGDVSQSLSSVTGADTSTPHFDIKSRPATLDWKHLLFAIEGVEGKSPTFSLDRSTMQDRNFAPSLGWLPLYIREADLLANNLNWVQATSRTLTGGDTGTIDFSFDDPLPAGRIYVSTHPMQQNAYAAVFAAELLSDYPSIASPTSSADTAGVYNTSPYEEDERLLPIGENDQFSIKLAFGGATTDGGPKRKLVLTVGTHAAGEHFSWLPFESCTREILDGTSATAIRIRANFDVYLYFNVTPNGLTGGHYRWNFRVVTDPNRDFIDKTLQEIAALTGAMVADTGGGIDAFLAFHTFARYSENYIAAVRGTGGTTSTGTAAFISNLAALQPSLREIYYGEIDDTGSSWAIDTLGAKVSLEAEMGMRAPTDVATAQEVGVTWLEALATTDEQGIFYNPGATPTAAVSVSTAYDPVVSTETTGATVTPTAAVSVSLAYDPSVTTNVNVLPTLAQSVSFAYDPRVRAGRLPPTQRIIIQGVYSTRSVIQGRYQR